MIDACFEPRMATGSSSSLASSWPSMPWGDRMAEAHAMVSLVEQGWADQNRCGPRLRLRGANGAPAAATLRGRRALPALEHGERLPARSGASGDLAPAMGSKELQSRKACSHRAMARRLGVSPKAIRKLLRRLECKDYRPGANPNWRSTSVGGLGTQTCPLFRFSTITPPAVEPATKGGDPNLSAFCATAVVPATWDTDPSDRWNDRLMAYLGLLDDAAPMFGSRTGGGSGWSTVGLCPR